MQRITYADLIRSIQGQAFSKESLADVFELDPVASEAFLPVFRINTSVVDVSGVELAALASGNALALSAHHTLRQRELAARAKTGTVYKIIAEGDSWFSHPLAHTVIDELQKRGHAIDNLAHWGDTIEDMLVKKQYMKDLRTGAVQEFLFSGGGNDVLGDLTVFIRLYNNSYGDPNNPAHVNYYIDAQFTSILKFLAVKYNELIADVRSASTTTILTVHGYAYARAEPSGPYLGKHFETLGFDLNVPRTKALAWAIIRELVDRFNLVLITFQRNNRGVKYHDFRKVVLQADDSDWFDYELHPSRKAANKMADVYEKTLPVMAAAATA